MSTYEFRFITHGALERAVSDTLSCEYVEDCHVNVPVLFLRFRAHDGPGTEGLIKRIQHDGYIIQSNTAWSG